MAEKLKSEERKLLEDLIKYQRRRKGWKKSLQKGLKIPEKGLSEKLPRENYGGAVDSLQKKGLIEIEEKEVTRDRAKWNIDYDKDVSSLEKEKNIRGTKEKRYLKIAEEKIGKIIDELGVEE